MLQIIIKNIADYCLLKNRWWIPLCVGLTFALGLPPFNHEFHWIFALFPFFTFIVLIPLFFFSVIRPLKRAIFYTYLYSFTASLVQYYWIGFVTAEGLWHLILLGLVLISAVIGLLYLFTGMMFRIVYRKCGRWYILLFPAIWVCIDYLRSVGQISFPWSLLGYSFTPILPIAQLASLTGVWGLTFLIIVANILFWELLLSYYHNENMSQKWIHVCLFFLLIGGIAVWGGSRIKHIDAQKYKKIDLSLIQNNIDQFHWGNNSLDTAFTITESMIRQAAKSKPRLIIGPESALLCYLDRRPDLSRRVFSWADSLRTPLLLGALHWDKAPPGAFYDYFVYNSAFLIQPDSLSMKHYNKTKLVPFSEIMPFENIFPILSRVNLGEADFHRGEDPTIFSIDNDIKAAPFICYEMIYPSFIQKRINLGANVIITITNDGWFGRSTAAFQHATMARMRAIENDMSVVRCANSGISMFIDPDGKITKSTSLYTRTILNGQAVLKSADTFYSAHGDWFVAFCAAVICIGIILFPFIRLLKRNKIN